MEYKTTVATYMIYHDARTLIYIKERIMWRGPTKQRCVSWIS